MHIESRHINLFLKLIISDCDSKTNFLYEKEESFFSHSDIILTHKYSQKIANKLGEVTRMNMLERNKRKRKEVSMK